MNPYTHKVKDIEFNFTGIVVSLDENSSQKGFGAFLNIEKNPTTELIESLKSWLAENKVSFGE